MPWKQTVASTSSPGVNGRALINANGCIVKTNTCLIAYFQKISMRSTKCGWYFVNMATWVVLGMD